MKIVIIIFIILWIWLIYEFINAPAEEKNDRIDYDNDRVY